MSANEDAEKVRRNFKGPYTSHHPIPTIQKYKEEKKDRIARASSPDGVGEGSDAFAHEAEQASQANQDQKTRSRAQSGSMPPQPSQDGQASRNSASDDGQAGDEHMEDTSQTSAIAKDPKDQRKQMKKRKDERAEREVTDPVTHLPIRIHDFTGKDIKSAPENEPPTGSQSKSATGFLGQIKDDEQLKSELKELQAAHLSLQAQFPPPNFDAVRKEVTNVVQQSTAIGLAALTVFAVLAVAAFAFAQKKNTGTYTLLSYSVIAVCIGGAVGITIGMQSFAANKVQKAWENEVWEAEREEGKRQAKQHRSETTQWLNSLLASVWPLVNPDLFTSVADTLEDVMQASLPKVVRMVSVEDIGQGSESIRILGIKWLPTGAATRSVTEDGKLESSSESNNDRTVSGEGEVQKPDDDGVEGKNAEDGDKDSQEQENSTNIAEGLEAESGDFVNVEIAFSYRARGHGKTMHTRAKNAHLYLAFYLVAGIKFPVWVELHGLVGIVRLRLQLTPDPPFFSLCTLTFLGQPKVDVSCVPLSKHGLNIMDLPLISNFVQSAIDAGLSTLVAPRNMTLDLKEMLMGDDFKKDTNARGVLLVKIIRGFDFKEGDAGIAFLKKGSADPYVSVGWAKFGKPVWSTRVIMNEMEPCWEETAFIPVTPEELNVEERLRVQLWDSDRTTADDDLGRIEVDLKELMTNHQSNGKMWRREDGFRALKKGESMPGKLCWEVGYFTKLRILDSQLAEQDEDPDVKTVDQLKSKVYEESEKKLREASRDESAEIEQQKQQDFKARQDEMIIRSPPPQEYPTGILSIQIHQITGLELEAINKRQVNKNDTASDEEEEGDDLPSSYCTVILNHQKIFRTRTKPKNGKPFFNAGTERVIRDWRNTEVHISVRDSRVHEDDPLLGIVYLPIGKLLAKRSQISEFFPLAGGIGYGKARVSIVFRAIQLQVPRPLLGWEFGTLEISSSIRASDDLAREYKDMRLKLRTSIGKGKAHADANGVWSAKNDKPIRIPVKKRYSSALTIEFRRDKSLQNSTAAFSILWLKDVVDNEDQKVKLPVWKGTEGLERARKNCVENCGVRIGYIELDLNFWSGLSGHHCALAHKDDNLEDVMEVLDAANDNNDTDLNFDSAGDSSSSSSSDDTDDEYDNSNSLSSSGKRGTVDSFKDYKANRKQLHRKNRDLMQWKGARTAKWVEGKIEDAKGSVTSLFKHNERESGIETEV